MIATLRANWALVAVGLLGVALMIILPLALDLFELLQITLYAIFGILALSLAFIWGYGQARRLRDRWRLGGTRRLLLCCMGQLCQPSGL